MSTEPEKRTEQLPAAPDAEPAVAPASPAASAAEPPPAAPPPATPPPAEPPPPPPAAAAAPPPPPPGQPRWQRVSRRSWLGITVAAVLIVACLCGATGIAIGAFAGHRFDDRGRRNGPNVVDRYERDHPNAPRGPRDHRMPDRRKPTPATPTPTTPTPSASATA